MAKSILQGTALALLMIAANVVAQVNRIAPVTAHQPVSSGPAGRAVARVNGVPLTDRDLLREEYAIFPYARLHGGTIPREIEPGIRKGALDMIVFEELVYQEAQKRGFTIPPQSLTKAQNDFRRQFDPPAAFQQYLRSEFGGNELLLRDKIRRSLLIEKLLKSEVDSKAAVSLVELRTYYDKNPVRFQYPESFAIQTISVIPPANASPEQLKEAHKRADDALKQAKATKTAEEFGLLAEKISDDDYRVMMGDHKWVDRSSMPPQMLEPALKMKAGDISGLAQVGQILVIFRMNRHIPAGKRAFPDVKDALRNELTMRKTNELRAAFDKKLRSNAKVEIL
jgi:peptidyl-prolyl cis-trans isomerase C